MKKFLSLVLALALALSVCSSALAAGDTVRWGVYSAPKGWFNSALYTDMYDYYVLQLTQNTLIELDEESSELAFKGKLAKSYEVSEDGTEITFYLRDDVNWHDGEKFTADDVVWFYTAMVDGKVNASHASYFLPLKGAQDYFDGKADSVAGIEKIDDYTVKFSYDEPFAPALTYFAAIPVMAKHIWENIPGEDWFSAEALRTPVGTGPYKFVEYVQDQYVTLTANEDYFEGAPKIKNFVYRVVNEDTAQIELKNGDLDVVSMISTLKDDDLKLYTDNGLDLLEFADAGYQLMNINNRDEKYADVRVRQALAYAINRQGIVDNLIDGHGLVVNAPMIASSWAYPQPEENILNPYEYNPEKAKELLAEAGWVDTDNDGIVDKDGVPFKTSLIYPTGNKVRENSAPIIKQCLAQVGIDCELESMDFNSLSGRMVKGCDFELGLIGLSIEADPDVFNYYHSSQADLGNFNFSRYENPELDALIELSRVQMDPAERKATFYEINTILNRDVTTLWLYSMNEVRAYSPKLLNYKVGNFWEFPDVNLWEFAE